MIVQYFNTGTDAGTTSVQLSMQWKDVILFAVSAVIN